MERVGPAPPDETLVRKAVFPQKSQALTGVAELVVELEHGHASLVQHVWKIADELQLGALDITLEQVDDWLGGEQSRNVDELDFYALFR